MFTNLLGPLLILALPCMTINIPKKQNWKPDDIISLTVSNCSDQPVYYKVALEIKSASGWEGVISDIDNLTQNDIIRLVKLDPKDKKIKKLQISYIPPKYFHSARTTFRLLLGYSSNKRLEDNPLRVESVEFTVEQVAK